MIRRHLCRGSNRLPVIAIAVALWAALASGQSKAEPNPPAPAAAATPAAETIRMDHISVEVIGKGSPVILIPGLSSPRAVWDGVAPDLAKRHTVYLVQVNGFGGEDPGKNLQPGVLDGIVADLHKLIDSRKLHGAALVGHSMGGLATPMLARAHPGDVGRALIVDALPFVGSAFVPGSTAESIRPQAEAMRAQMTGLHGKPMPEAYAQAIANTNALKPESRAMIVPWMKAADMRVSGQAMYEDATTDLRPDLKRIAVPLTVLVPWYAPRTEAATLAIYKGEYAGAPAVSFVPVSDSGHFIMLDQPAAFAAALAKFLG